MSNRMIIIEKCEDCPKTGLGLFSRKNYICLPMSEEKDCLCPKEGIPDWCPLPSVPEYSDSDLTNFESENEKTIASAYVDGWNDCVDAIIVANDIEID